MGRYVHEARRLWQRCRGPCRTGGAKVTRDIAGAEGTVGTGPQSRATE